MSTSKHARPQGGSGQSKVATKVRMGGLRLILPLLAVAAASAPSARAGEFDIPYHPTRIIVRYKPGATAAAKEEARAAVTGARSRWRSRITPGLEIVEVPEGQVPAAVLAFRQQPSVLYVEPGYRITLFDTPNDPDFGKLWGLHNTGQTVNGVGGTYDADVDAPQAWDVWQGSAWCVVAVMDTGVDYSHPDLYRNIWINQGEIPRTIYSQLTDVDSDGWFTFVDLNDSANGGYVTDVNQNGYIDGGDILNLVADHGWADEFDNDGNGYEDDIVGWDAYGNGFVPDRDPNPSGSAGSAPHGTRVAGVVAATGNNSEGIVGLARGCRIMAIKFGDEDGNVFLPDALPALDYLIANVVRYNVRVSIHSWSTPQWQPTCLELFPQSLYDKFAGLHGTGQHIAVAAASNYDPDPGNCHNRLDNDNYPLFPANFGVTWDYSYRSLHVDGLDSVLSVAATTNEDELWLYSRYGANTVHLGAPGANVYSSYFTGPSGLRAYGYAFDDGTSFAAPHVAATAALLWSRFPAWTMHQVRDRVLSTARKPNCEGMGEAECIVGKAITNSIVNAYRAVNYDCNGNGLDDAVDIADGTSLDCNGYESNCCVEHDNAECGSPPASPCGCDNAQIAACVCAYPFLEYCCDPLKAWDGNCVEAAAGCGALCAAEPDGLPDECDFSRDCDANGVPDGEQFAAGSGEDCNQNCALDSCDILGGASNDCNGNGVPDECDVAGDPDPADCNENEIPDMCDVHCGVSGGACDVEGCGEEADCNDNCSPDECDVAEGGGSCDIDDNDVPDECAACCVQSTCSDMLPADCAAVGGSAFFGATCGECSCSGGVVCCFGTTCEVTLECACVARGGRAVVGGGCTPNPCTTGVCCGAESDCYETTLGTCNSGFEFQPLGTCDPSTCDQMPSAFCPPGSFDPGSDVDPVSGTKDARRPHPENDNSFAAREGIGSPNNYEYGPERITVDLGASSTCAGHGRCWKLCETGIEEVKQDAMGQPPLLTDNRFRSITESSLGVYEILLDRPISGAYWTTISYLGDSTGGSVTQYASLPCDANNDGIAQALTTACESRSQPNDVYFWVECCFQHKCPGLQGADYRCNIDHGVPGNWGFIDLGYMIDMLLGRGTYYAWECTTLVENTTCEGGGQQMMAGGEVLFTDDRAVDPVEWFVDFLSTATVPEGHTEYDLRMVILILARFYGDELRGDAKAALVWQLEDPSRTFATGWVADMVPEVVERIER